MINGFTWCGTVAPNSRRTLALAASLTALFIVTLCGLAQAAPGSSAPPKPKISSKQAEAAAAKKIGGKVVSSKYELEEGHWQYAVIVTDKKGQMYEAEVNSTTGKVTATEKTSLGEEAKEEAADKKATAGKGVAKSSKKEDEND